MNCILSSSASLSLPSTDLSSKNAMISSQSLELPPILGENFPDSIPSVSTLTSFADNTSPNPPAFLEPTPLTESYHFNTKFSPKFPCSSKTPIQTSLPTLVPSSSSSCSSVSSNSPSPVLRNASPPYHNHTDSSVSIINSDATSLFTPIAQSSSNTKLHPLMPIQSKAIYQSDYREQSSFWNNRSDYAVANEVRLPLSPTMIAASAAAAVESVNHSPSNISSDVFLNGYDQKALKPIVPNERIHNISKDGIYSMENDLDHGHHIYSPMSYMPQESKPFSVTPNQSMFLTKNAHIKRPRNAWIRFRCHYGQALKSQDPTLRAEEISKRASRRWANLSEMEKKPWHDLAEQEKQAHKEAFPNYRYCPRRSNTTSFAGEANTQSIKSISLYNKFGLDEEENMKNKKRRF